MFNLRSENVASCHYFTVGQCHSCPTINIPYERQVTDKTTRVKELLPLIAEQAWLPTQLSHSLGFRNKAKMVVSGSANDAKLGILDRDYRGQDLTECPLYDAPMRRLLAAFSGWIRQLGISPYSVAEKRGELKYILVTQSVDGEFMVRWVLRSKRWVPRLQSFITQMRADFPSISVVSVNILAEHVALTEGAEEILLYGDFLRMRLGQVQLLLQPQSFFQTNSFIAQAMYTQAQRWAAALKPVRALDLFCGVGGFALHLSAVCESVIGVEISAAAIAAAQRGAAVSGVGNVEFYAADATVFSVSEGGLEVAANDLILVNPPRRGVGVELAEWLNNCGAGVLIYSSCNPLSLAKDLELLSAYRVLRARVFDMFPGTHHAEVMVLLSRV